jgi:hypothetical protein
MKGGDYSYRGRRLIEIEERAYFNRPGRNIWLL